jgi:hypothetical protein
VKADYRGERGNATIEELWEELFSMLSAATTSHYKKQLQEDMFSARSVTSFSICTAERSEKGTKCLGA